MTRRQASSASQTTPKMLCLPCDSYPVILSFLECIAYVVLSHKEWSMRLINKNCTELSWGGRTYFIDTPPLSVGCGIQYRISIRDVHIGLKPGKTKHVLQNYEDAMQHLYKLSSSLQSLRVTYPCITLGLSRQRHKSAESHYTPELATIQRGLEQFLGKGDERKTKISIEFPSGVVGKQRARYMTVLLKCGRRSVTRIVRT